MRTTPDIGPKSHGRHSHDDIASSIRRGEINESIARRKARRLEREFGKTIRLAQRVRILSAASAGAPATRRSKSRLRNGTVSPIIFRLPVVIGRRGSSPDGKTTFTYKITAIPKTRSERILRDGTKVRPGAAAEGARYAAGARSDYLIGDRTQLTDDGRTLVLSNIDPNNDPEKCAEFFELVEKHERNASPDQVTIAFGKCQSLWRKVVEHPECDPALMAAYRDNPDGEVVVELCRGAAALKKVIGECDVRSKAWPGEQEARDRADGITWKLGRGGRTQWRVMVSFPAQFSSAQRREALAAICAQFEAMGCMYMGVIHQASASNDRRNHHCHIDLYDRPCRRLSGDEERDLANVPKRWKEEVQREYRNGLFEADVGRWDFEVTRMCRYASGNKRLLRIFRANKSEPMRKYSMPKDSRRDIAAIINRIALRDFGRELVDHETNARRGRDKEPDRPLGLGAHALEGKGWATEIGLENERKHADKKRRDVVRPYQERIHELERTERDFLARTANLRLLELRTDERQAVMTAVRDARRLALLKRDAALLQLEINRQLSSAYLVIKTSGRVIRMGEDKRGDHAKRRAAARAYWRTWVGDHADDVRCLREMKTSISQLDRACDLQLVIDRALVPLSASEQAAQDRHDLPTRAILPTRRMSSLLRGAVANDRLTAAPERNDGRDVAKDLELAKSRADVTDSGSHAIEMREKPKQDDRFVRSPTELPHQPHPPVRRNIMRKASMSLAGAVSPKGPELSPAVAKGQDHGQTGSSAPPLRQAVDEQLTAPYAVDSQTMNAGDAIAAQAAPPSQPSPKPLVVNVLPEKHTGVQPGRGDAAIKERDESRPPLTPHGHVPSPGSCAHVNGTDLPAPAPTRASAATAPPIKTALPSPTASTLELAQQLAYGPNAEANEPFEPDRSARGIRRRATPAANPPPIGPLPKLQDANRSPAPAVEVAEGDRIRFEREMLVHVVRTERIRLEFKNGSYAIPDHPKIPAAWRRHSPAVRVELERDQKEVEGELRALVRQIRSGGLSADDRRSQFMLQKFADINEVQRAISAARQINLQQSLAASQGRGL